MKLIVGLVASILLVIGFGYAGLSGRNSQIHGDLIVARNFAELAQMSDVIVLGTISHEGGTRNTARDPKDLSKPDPNLTVNSQEYVVSVDTVLKGAVDQTIVVATARSGSLVRGMRTDSFEYDNFIPLKVGTRYALLLRVDPYNAGMYALGFEPKVFELGASANVISTWTEAKRYFPAISTSLFVSTLRAAALAAPATTAPTIRNSTPGVAPLPGEPTPRIALPPQP